MVTVGSDQNIRTKIVPTTSLPDPRSRGRLRHGNCRCDGDSCHGSGCPWRQNGGGRRTANGNRGCCIDDATFLAENAVGIDFVQIRNRAVGIDDEATGVSFFGLAVDQVVDFQIGVDLQTFDTWDRSGVDGCGRVDKEQGQLVGTSRNSNGRRSKRGGGRGCGRLRYGTATNRGIGGNRYGVLASNRSNESVGGIEKGIPRGNTCCAGWERIVSESSGAASEVRGAVAIGLGQS